jgi:hypothetical protein
MTVGSHCAICRGLICGLSIPRRRELLGLTGKWKQMEKRISCEQVKGVSALS